MNTALRDDLLEMERRDDAMRAELAADGTLFEGYHPRMELVHRENAARLREMISAVGWPTVALVGADGAEAAWRVAQHSIGDPGFMRQCRRLIDEASSAGAVPRRHFAYIDDRIRCFEGKAQRYGTQFRDGVNGPEPFPLEEPDRVDALRRDLELPSLAEAMGTQRREHGVTGVRDVREHQAREIAWRKRVGWVL
jgi:hypothetical protein